MYYARATGGSCGSTVCNSILINTYDLNVYQVPFGSICENNTFILNGGFPLNGTYSGLGVSDSIFDPQVAGVGTHTIEYVFTHPTTGCQNSTTQSIKKISMDHHSPSNSRWPGRALLHTRH